VTDQNVKFKDFSKKRVPINFMVDGETFHCMPALSVEVMQEVALKAGDVTNTTAFSSMTEFFGNVLQPESFIRLKAKMSDKVEPLELDQATDIFLWLLEVYGLRPTTSSSGSSDGSPTDGAGTTSTAGASPEVSSL